MAEYDLYCFAQSGNAYRAALMLNLIGADWRPQFVDFFGKGVQRTPEYRETINEMGEVPVLAHGAKKLTQSGVILTYLAERYKKFLPRGDDERLEALRWIIFDNQKLNGFLGPYRFLKNFARTPGDPAVMAFLKGRIDGNLGILDHRLAKAPYMLGTLPTIADISLCGYLYYPAEEFGFDAVAGLGDGRDVRQRFHPLARRRRQRPQFSGLQLTLQGRKVRQRRVDLIAEIGLHRAQIEPLGCDPQFRVERQRRDRARNVEATLAVDDAAESYPDRLAEIVRDVF